MLTLDKIVWLLRDRRLSVVSKETGISVGTLANIKSGRQTNPTYGTMAILSGYLARTEEAASTPDES